MLTDKCGAEPFYGSKTFLQTFQGLLSLVGVDRWLPRDREAKPLEGC